MVLCAILCLIKIELALWIGRVKGNERTQVPRAQEDIGLSNNVSSVMQQHVQLSAYKYRIVCLLVYWPFWFQFAIPISKQTFILSFRNSNILFFWFDSQNVTLGFIRPSHYQFSERLFSFNLKVKFKCGKLLLAFYCKLTKPSFRRRSKSFCAQVHMYILIDVVDEQKNFVKSNFKLMR